MRLGLFRRRETWTPTARGWLALLAVAAASTWFFVANIRGFLAVTEPVGARTLVVEGWTSPKEMARAVDVFRAGGYERIVTTGGPLEGWPELLGHRDFADLAAEYMTQHGIARDAVVAVPAPASAQERTFLSAVTVREWAKRSGADVAKLDVFTSATHARRTRLMYRAAFGAGVEIGVIAADVPDPLGRPWWRTSGGLKDVLAETIGFVWAKCFFWPGPPGSYEEKWGIPRGVKLPDEPR
jgi:hypothetical protein